MTVGVSELQKNISIFKNLDETVKILDKKTKKILAFVLPNKKTKTSSLTKTLAGSLQNKTNIKVDNINQAIKDAYKQEMSKHA